MMEAWVACDWELVPTGLKALGNDIEAPVGQVEKGVQDARGFLEKICSESQRRQVITQAEVEGFLALACAGEDVWQTFHHDEKLHARRHKDRTLVGGAIFVKVSGYFPGVTVDHVAHCYMNFNDRAGWDRQMDGFKVLQHGEGNDLMHTVLHSPPLSDRDFLVWHIVLRHTNGKGLMFYSRSADDSFYPPGRAVRAMQYIGAHQLIQDSGGVTFTTITAVEPYIPFLPRWVMSLLLPSEFKRWRSSVLRRCSELRGQRVPCTGLFTLDTPEVEIDTKPSVGALSTGIPELPSDRLEIATTMSEDDHLQCSFCQCLG
ncbi:unnamed protein product [Durusdinium trenchii]|uniref:START domain-containing protein n=1 Tax=Durusdinium trenchii TaxID=1381693 RepID=A0ABP0MWN2_9DINO